jgi:hypothetical protein
MCVAVEGEEALRVPHGGSALVEPDPSGLSGPLDQLAGVAEVPWSHRQWAQRGQHRHLDHVGVTGDVECRAWARTLRGGSLSAQA